MAYPLRPGISLSRPARIGSVDAAFLDAFGLDPDVLHLNHGAFGAGCQVDDTTQRRATEVTRQPALD
jgi:hypothetical protein